MTDLIKRLGSSCYLAFEDGTNDYSAAQEAIDCIEELVKERDEAITKRTIAEGLAGLAAFKIDGHSAMITLSRDQVGKRMKAETKLTKAMEALRETGEVIIFHTDETSWRVWGEDVVGDIRTALAELEVKE